VLSIAFIFKGSGSPQDEKGKEYVMRNGFLSYRPNKREKEKERLTFTGCAGGKDKEERILVTVNDHETPLILGHLKIRN